MPDHIHMLIGMRPHQSISKLLQMVKEYSSKWIKQKRLCPHQFAWQDGYGAFSYSKNQIDNVILYTQHQQKHHRKKTIREEYISMLNEAGIEYEERYFFTTLSDPKSPIRKQYPHAVPEGTVLCYHIICYRHFAPTGHL